jgi:hypothetical protein
MLKTSRIVELCRICKASGIELLIDFGQIAFTGAFHEKGDLVEKAPLALIRCANCGLVQLGHSYSNENLYGASYGYESHLNNSMVRHLQQKALALELLYLSKSTNPVVVDIASNDGTFLSGFKNPRIEKIGIDPLIEIVGNFYPIECKKINSFFSSKAYWECNKSPATLVTSLSVLYDLDDPINFASQIFEILADGGIWHFEQSYLPLMLQTNSYDTICHEHVLYLSLHDIINILDKSGFQLKEASINSVNGGSISVTAVKTDKQFPTSPYVEFLLQQEIEIGIIDGEAVKRFITRHSRHTKNLKKLILKYKSLGYDVVGLGASTKGNTLIQLLGLSASDIRIIGEINPRKYGKQTPGSAIPIVPETEIMSNGNSNTIVVVFPWHFRDGFINKLQGFLSSGGKLLFPLPHIEEVQI